MNSINYFCKNHPNFSLYCVLRAKPNIKFPSKVCNECIQQFNIPQEQVLQKEDFALKLLQRSNQLNLGEQIAQQNSNKFSKGRNNHFTYFQNERINYDDLKNLQNRGREISETQLIQLKSIGVPLGRIQFSYKFLDSNIFQEWVQKNQQSISQTQKAVPFIKKQTFNFSKINHLVELISTNLKMNKINQRIYELEGLKKVKNQLEKAKFQLIIQSNGDRLYLNDGEILREERYTEFQENEILNTLEQIKYLKDLLNLMGKNSNNGILIGSKNKQVEMCAISKGKRMEGGLIYAAIFLDGKNAVEEGHYQKDIRIGNWKFIFQNQIIGGGLYEDQARGIKPGRWTELRDGFNEHSQVIFRGNMKTKKKLENGIFCIGLMTLYHFNRCGFYEQGKDNFKMGKWVELNHGFQEYSQVSYKGEYHQSKKIGKWKVWYKDYNSYIEQKNGGGEYDLNDGGMKIGKWIKLSDRFSCDFQVTYIGEYKGNIKLVNGTHITDIIILHLFKKCKASGYYDQRGNGIKIGKWIELN